MIIVNFAHPLTALQLQGIQDLARNKVAAVLEIPSHINPATPLVPQIEKMLDSIGFTPQEWQTSPLLVNLPSLNFSAATALAQLHGRIGYFPPVLHLRPVTGRIARHFEVGEILNLQAMREQARGKRF